MHAAHELLLDRLRAGIPLAARCRVQRDQVHVHERAERLVQLLAEQVRAPRLIVDVADQRVLDRDAAPGLVGVIAGGVEHLGDRTSGCSPAPRCRAVRRRGCAATPPGVTDMSSSASLRIAGARPDRRHGHRALRNAEPVGSGRGDPAHRGHHPLVVGQRLAHPHEHDVGQPARTTVHRHRRANRPRPRAPGRRSPRSTGCG